MSTTNEVLHPRDLLVHLREWLIRYQQTHTRHFGESDNSGHPHGWAGVVIPDWEVRQRLDEIDQSLKASGVQTALNSHPEDGGPQLIAWEPQR